MNNFNTQAAGAQVTRSQQTINSLTAQRPPAVKRREGKVLLLPNAHPKKPAAHSCFICES